MPQNPFPGPVIPNRGTHPAKHADARTGEGGQRGHRLRRNTLEGSARWIC